MDVNAVLLERLKTTLIHDGPAHGRCEGAKALDKHHVHLCVLASNCEELVCQAGGGTLCRAPNDNKKPRECVGLCKINRGGEATESGWLQLCSGQGLWQRIPGLGCHRGLPQVKEMSQ